ncbi:MAG TPA: ABC transporter ATP-binding protein, partial [Rhodospirillales bacterium]|nr:ABC transporter ATP-binding protein [Rhodospirillales bacterium]
FSDRLGTINRIRLDIFRKKFFIKFLNNFLAQLTPFFFYSIGGYLVIGGSMSIGALVAVLAAYKDLSAPWKELLKYYQTMEDSRIKYEQLVDQFEPDGMIEEHLIDIPKTPPVWIDGPISANNLTYQEDEAAALVNGAFFTLDPKGHTAITGPDANGKSMVTDLIARRIWPTNGRLKIGETFMDELPMAFYGRHISYVDQEPYIRSGTLMDNLLLGLNHEPDLENLPPDVDPDRLIESEKSGNSPYDIKADWIDYAASGAANQAGLLDLAVHVLDEVDLKHDVFQIGLQRTFDTDRYPSLVDGVLQARAEIRERLQSDELKDLVEVFDIDKFNTNASVAENLLFGAPRDDTFNVETLGGNLRIAAVLDQCNLTGQFLDIGTAVAKLMVELFHDLPPGHDFFERFSFIDSEMLPEYQAILGRVAEIGLGGLEENERHMLSDLTFKLIPARHHLDMIDDHMQKKILLARHIFIDHLDHSLASSIEFFHAEKYIASSNILNNILFGKTSFNKAGGPELINDLLSGVIEKLGLETQIAAVGLDWDVGISGKRLSMPQRQKLSLARCLIKRPQLLIVNKALASLDPTGQQQIFAKV